MAAIINKEAFIENEAINKATLSVANTLKEVTEELDNVVLKAKEAGVALSFVGDLKKTAKAIDEIRKVNDQYNATQAKKLELDKKIEALSAKIIADETKNRKLNTEAAIAEERLKQSLLKTEQQVNNSKKNTVIISKEESAALRDVAKETRLIAQFNNAAEGSYDRLNAKYQLNIMKLNAMSQAERENTNAGKQLTKQSAELYAQMIKLDEATGRHQRSVGNYAKGFNGLQFQVTQLARELPALAYGPQMFIAAISNNFPMLQDEIARTRIENEKLRAEGKKGVPVWKQMAGAIMSWQTMLVVGMTIYMSYSKEINAWVKSLFGGVSAAEKMKVAQERLNEANKRGYEDGQQDLVHLRLLYNATQDQTRALNERLAAVNEIQQMYPNYFANMSDEEIMAGKAGKAYYELANAIMASAKAKAYESIIVENEVKKRDLEQKVLEERKGLAFAQTNLEKKQQMFSKMGVEGQKDYALKVVQAQRLVDDYTESIKNLNTEISAIEYSSKELADQIKPTDLLSDIGGKKPKGGTKGNEFTDLEQAKKFNEQELADFKIAQEKKKQVFVRALDEMFAERESNGVEQVRYDTELAQLESKNKLDAIDWQIEQNKRILENVKLTAEERATIISGIAQLEVDKANETADAVIAAQKRQTVLDKAIIKQDDNERKEFTTGVISDSLATADENKLSEQEKALEKIKAAKGSKEAVMQIQHELTMFMIDEDIKAQQRILDTANLEPDAYEAASKRLRQLRLERGEEEIDFANQTEAEIMKIRQQKIQAVGDLINEGFNFSQQIYSNQEQSVKKAYDYELAVAGESVEGKIMAERKYEKEMAKIRKKQAIADKAQAAFSIGLNTAMAVMQVTAQTGVGAALLVPLIIALGAVQLATVLAKPIPAYAEGTDSHKGGIALMGEEGAELVTEPSGKQWLTDSKPMLYDLAKGSSVRPADKTAQMLQSYAASQSNQIYVDLSSTNKHLQTIADNTKGKAENHYDLSGKLIQSKRSNVTTHYV